MWKSAVAFVVVGMSLGVSFVSGQEEMPQLGRPAEMDQVAFLVGDWQGEVEYRMQPGGPTQMGSLNMKMEPIIDGCALRAVSTGSLMNMDFKGSWTITYDRETKKFQGVWLDNSWARQGMEVGDIKDGAIVLFGKFTSMGVPIESRNTTKKISDTEMEWIYDVSMDGGKTWFTSMKAKYVKQ